MSTPQWEKRRTSGHRHGRRRAFVFGRRNRKATAVVLAGRRRGPVRGPWTLQAVVSTN